MPSTPFEELPKNLLQVVLFPIFLFIVICLTLLPDKGQKTEEMQVDWDNVSIEIKVTNLADSTSVKFVTFNGKMPDEYKIKIFKK